MTTSKILTTIIPLLVLVLAVTACTGESRVDAASEHAAVAQQMSPTETPVTILPSAGATELGAPGVEVAEGGAERAAFVVRAAKPTAESPASGAERAAFVVRAADPASAAEMSGGRAAETPPGEAPTGALPEGCFDAAPAIPVTDVTIPDGTAVDPAATFTKIWRVRNAGTCAWNEVLGTLQWTFVSGERMSGPSAVPIAGAVPAGGETDVEVVLTAPAVPGRYEGRWQAYSPQGDAFGTLFWVLIDVPAPDDGAAFGGLPPSDVNELAREIWQRINGERAAHKLYQLAYNEKLALAAQKQADDCSQRGSCSHIGSDGSDESVRVRREGFVGSVDESWAWVSSPAAAVNLWLDEVPPNDWHRRMLLTDYFREVGVGVAPAPSGYYFVAVFGLTGH